MFTLAELLILKALVSHDLDWYILHEIECEQYADLLRKIEKEIDKCHNINDTTQQK